VAILTHLVEELTAMFTDGVEYILSLWQALNLATDLQSEWDPSEAPDRIRWFAEQIVDLWSIDPQTDQEFIEDRIDQIISDEWSSTIEDGSDSQVAKDILHLQSELDRGRMDLFNRLKSEFEEQQQRRRNRTQRNEAGQITSGMNDDSNNEDDEDEDSDMEIDDAPDLVPAKKEWVPPEIDEDGFTKVTSKRKK
jgi:pre-rRNA-processing protein TSR2